MKKIIRLTESELHNLVRKSAMKVLQEQQDNAILLQVIAQSIERQGQLTAKPGENDAEFLLQGGRYAYITYEVLCSPYVKHGAKSNDYDVPDSPDEIIDDFEVEIESIDYCNDDGECIQIDDNGIVKEALKNVLDIDYDDYDVPDEEDYFYYED